MAAEKHLQPIEGEPRKDGRWMFVFGRWHEIVERKDERNPSPDELWDRMAGLMIATREDAEEHFPEIRRCNQDDLGDRRAVEHLTRATLQNGSSACIDRTNFDAS